MQTITTIIGTILALLIFPVYANTDNNSTLALAANTASIIQNATPKSPLKNISNHNDSYADNIYNHNYFPQYENHIRLNNSFNKKISLDFQNIPVKTLLQLLADFTHQNMVISGAINSNISLRLHDISWYQALTIILQTQGLAQQQIGNTLLIAPLTEITTQQAAKLQAEQQLADAAPLQSILIPVQYGKAYQIAALLKNQNHSLLSTRGTVTADARTNTVWVQDVPEKLTVIQYFVQHLDVPVKQISIEARIVNVDTKYEQELGVRFGSTQINNNSTNTISNTAIPANGISPSANNNPLNHLNIDLPATNTGIPGGASSLGLAFAKLGSGTILDLELSALESEGGGEIISKPHLITNNDQPALILSGEEIPYQETTVSGATSVTFKKAVLSLSVTPQINPNGKIGLTLKVNQDRPSSTLIQGVPAIDTHQIETHVIVNNGQTVVLGGIYEQTQRNQIQRVPFISKLPLIGPLFRHTIVHQDKKELLIFVTPTVV